MTGKRKNKTAIKIFPTRSGPLPKVRTEGENRISSYPRARALTYYLHQRRKDARIADVTPFDPLLPCIRESICHTLENAKRKKESARHTPIRPAPYIGKKDLAKKERRFQVKAAERRR